jgi:thymidine phosphorylase
MTGIWLAQEAIRAKRDGAALSTADIDRLVAGLSDGSLGDAQAGALAMAICIRGMERAETAALTRAMAHSGTTMAWDRQALGRPVLDKHSTGGVGDKVSLMLAPLLAACGAVVPMISGRGLGHTGGTLDKLESIPGYQVMVERATFARVVADVGCAIIGQTADLAPADRRLYAVRDVTATVESVPLITASILSKKLAADLDALVMDVTFGNGAFMGDLPSARILARTIVEVAESAGLAAVAVLTDMNQVLGTTAGNGLEVAEALDWLAGERSDPRLDAVVEALGVEALVAGGLAADADTARTALGAARTSGAAAETFARMVAALGGPTDLFERRSASLEVAPVRLEVAPARSGYVSAHDARALGLVVVGLGGGRRNVSDRVDHAVGLSEVAGVGTWVDGSRPLAVVHARSQDAARAGVTGVQAAISVGDERPETTPVVAERLGP